ncbi:MAG: formylglycine-generating enzyme family protein, partial [Nitrosomonadaceae bacterium]|nr:formylglycine-generating enzyme family protein [Nitrosomonadaceae bacterium]
PKSTQLPESLAPLTRRQAIEITDHRFHTDTDKLIKVLEKIVGVPVPPKYEPPRKPEETEKPGLSRFVAIAGAAGIGIVLAAGFYFGGMPSKPTPFQQEMENQTVEPVAATPAAETKPVSTEASAAIVLQPKKPEPAVKPVTEQTKVSITEPEMVRIEPGQFLIGSPETKDGRMGDEGPQHEITIGYVFEIGKYEVTFDEYDAFAKATERQLPSDNGWGRGKRPVINVSWHDAQDYVQWLSKQTGKKYRLPTEAEWEYAARAGTTTARFYPDGQQCQYANGLGQEGKSIAFLGLVSAECADGYLHTAPVGNFNQNQYGLFDMLGNVWEWTQDCWHDNYNKAPDDGSAWLEQNSGDCSRRVIRGGSWDSDPSNLRSAERARIITDNTGSDQGFRIARVF